MGDFSEKRMSQLFSRILMKHNESDSLFVTTTEEEFLSALEQGCDDVTGIPEFENSYKEQSDKLDAAVAEINATAVEWIPGDVDHSDELYQDGLLEAQRDAQRDLEMWGDA